tara:strand:+ start:337 stop:1071 length:735 start_codon:yes stop_codon:yes gene_type:complete
MPSILAHITDDGRRLWFGTNAFRVSGLKGSVTRKLIRAGKGTGLGHIKTVPGLIKKIERKMEHIGFQQTQFWLLEQGFTVREIKEMLVFMPESGRVTTRGDLGDVLAFEFFGVPQGTKPNMERLKSWTRKVIDRDMKLKKEYESKTPKQQESMLNRLNYSFALSIEKNGLRRNYTIEELDPANPDKIIVNWRGATGATRKVVTRHKPSSSKHMLLKPMAQQLGISEIFNHYTQRMHRGTRKFSR